VSAVSLNAMDPRSLNDLKRLAQGGDSPEALRAAAQQFEALFMEMVFKAMREASPSDGLLDNDQTRLFQQLHDQQIATELANSGRGSGLAEAIYRQLGGEAMERRQGNTSIGPDGRIYFDLANVPRRAAIPAAPRAAGKENPSAEAAEIAAGRAAQAQRPELPGHVGAFVDKVWDAAARAGRELGVPARFIVAQAALETGWGRAELRRADGSPSHNLFNIKAGSGWRGDVVELPVTEYANGRAYTENARFRAYDSYAEAFDDYVALLRDNPRYSGVLGQRDASAFASGLVRGGYATDPDYAGKLQRVIGGSLGALAGSGAERLAAVAR
jgi:flagellar protein FlgJ